MSMLKCIDKDYNICMERIDSDLWIEDEYKSFSYLCKFTFTNIFGNKVLELSTTEVDIFGFLDCLNKYLEVEINNIVYPFNFSNSRLQSFQFQFNKEIINNKVFHNLLISQYDPMNNIMINRLRVRFDDDSINEFCDLIYFSFLIDIDNYFISEYDIQ